MEVINKPFFNLREICDFIEHSDNNKIKETETLTNYDYDEIDGKFQNIGSKTIRENIIPSNPQIDSIRYDLVKTLITKILDDNSYSYDEKNNEYFFNMGTQIALNTLVEYKMIEN